MTKWILALALLVSFNTHARISELDLARTYYQCLTEQLDGLFKAIRFERSAADVQYNIERGMFVDTLRIKSKDRYSGSEVRFTLNLETGSVLAKAYKRRFLDGTPVRYDARKIRLPYFDYENDRPFKIFHNADDENKPYWVTELRIEVQNSDPEIIPVHDLRSGTPITISEIPLEIDSEIYFDCLVNQMHPLLSSHVRVTPGSMDQLPPELKARIVETLESRQKSVEYQ